MNYMVQVCHKCGKRSTEDLYWARLSIRTAVTGYGEPVVGQEAVFCPDCNDELQHTMSEFMKGGLWTPWSLEQFYEIE